MYKCVASEFDESGGLYNSVEDFENMCSDCFGDDAVPELKRDNDEGYYAIIKGTYTTILAKRFFILRDGKTKNEFGYGSYAVALEAAENLFGEMVVSEEFTTDVSWRSSWGELQASQAVELAGTEEDLEKHVWIVW